MSIACRLALSPGRHWVTNLIGWCVTAWPCSTTPRSRTSTPKTTEAVVWPLALMANTKAGQAHQSAKTAQPGQRVATDQGDAGKALAQVRGGCLVVFDVDRACTGLPHGKGHAHPATHVERAIGIARHRDGRALRRGRHLGFAFVTACGGVSSGWDGTSGTACTVRCGYRRNRGRGRLRPDVEFQGRHHGCTCPAHRRCRVAADHKQHSADAKRADHCTQQQVGLELFNSQGGSSR